MYDDVETPPPVYEEKTWGKEEDGESITDGYSFRGKQSFHKIVQELKVAMKKGIQREIEGIQFKALDLRKKGAGLEIDVEIIENDNRGVAKMKVYGPNKKKENVVMLSKSKESDSRYVTILSEKVIKPMMKRIVSGDLQFVEKGSSSVKKTISLKGRKSNSFKCPFCDVTSYSSPGLKGHITKKNNENQKQKENKTVVVLKTTTPVKRNISEEAMDVVDYLLNEVIEISDEEGPANLSKKISLEELSEEIVLDKRNT